MPGYFILTADQREDILPLSRSDAGIDPRLIDNPAAGPDLLGKYVVPVRLVGDPNYQNAAPDMVSFLRGMPTADLENGTIFLPPRRSLGAEFY